MRRDPIEDGLKQIRSKYPQAHAIAGKHGQHLIIVPSVMFPKGWNKTICTVLFVAPAGFPAACPENFWIDLTGIRLDPPYRDLQRHSDGDYYAMRTHPHNSNELNPIPGFPEWKDLTWFSWHLQAWNPNTDTLFTFLSVIRQRLGLTR